MEAVLAHLPRLAELRVWGCYSHSVLGGVQGSLPRLTVNARRPKQQELIPLAHHDLPAVFIPVGL